MIFKIVTFRDKNSSILYKPTNRVDLFDRSLAQISKNMKKTIQELDALGLAAPQVNIDQAICVINLDNKVQAFCNPEITYSSKEKEVAEEGCLSFPDIFLNVSRSKKITVNYQNIYGQKKTLEAEGLLARVLQHEIDHLNGKVFVEKA